MNPIITAAAGPTKIRRCHQARVSSVAMRALVLIVTIGVTSVANVVICKSIQQDGAYRNLSTRTTIAKTAAANVQEPIKSYVSRLALLAPLKKSDQQFQDDTQVDLLKTSESSPHGISLTLDGASPLDYLQQQYHLQQLSQQQHHHHHHHHHPLDQRQQSPAPAPPQQHRLRSNLPSIPHLSRSESGAVASNESSTVPCNKDNKHLAPVIGPKVSFQPELTAASTTSNSNAHSADVDRSSDDDDEADDGADDPEDAPAAADTGSSSKRDSLSSDESVAMASQSMPEPGADGYLPGPGDAADSDSDYPSAQSDAASAAQEQPDNEAAERSEAEAAEAKEAEAADKSALDEQQQQQREIIKAQAQSEAIAIREQQEALLRQQSLQQDMLLRRQQDDLRHQQRQQQQSALDDPMMAISRRMSPQKSGTSVPASFDKHRQQQQQVSRPVVAQAASHDYDNDDRIEPSHRSPVRDGIRYMDDYMTPRANTYKVNDALQGHQNPTSQPSYEANTFDDEIGVDYSIRRPQISAPNEGAPIKNDLLPVTSRQQPINLTQLGDLVPAAQGSYGALHDLGHYGGGHHGGGHHGGYYMFAHSHKKGQFDSGFKRGNKKSTISGHSSQHKSHADGHMKWKSKKGKGSHYWDYNHGHKKHGKGHGYYR